jgi:NADH-quinone oxidoreductase subunit I
MLGRGMLKGLYVTLRHMVESYLKGKRRFPRRYTVGGKLERGDADIEGMMTLQYPFERYDMFPRFRGVLCHLRDEQGQPRCTACLNCERACPHGVISIVGEGRGKQRRAKHYSYNLGRCIFCRLCVESCSFDAIEMSREYDVVSYCENQVLNLADLLAIGDRSGIKHIGEAWEEKEPTYAPTGGPAPHAAGKPESGTDA